MRYLWNILYLAPDIDESASTRVRMNSKWFKSNWQIALLVVFQLILSLFYIDAHSIDLDEPFSIFYSQFDLSALWKLFENENNPPLHFVLLHGWIKLFGTEPAAVRSLSLIFGIATSVVIYNIGKRLSGTVTGLLATLFFIFSNFHFYHNIEARSYPIFVFLFSCLLLLVLNVYRNYSHLSYAALAMLCSALFYTHYIAPLLLFVIGLYLLIHAIRMDAKKEKKQHLKGLFLITLPLFLLLSFPLLKLFFKRIAHVTKQGTWVPEAQWTELYGQLNKFMNGREVVVIILVWLIILLFFCKHHVIGYLKQLYQFSSKKFLVIIFLSIYLLAFVLSKLTNLHLFLDRYIYFLTIPLFLLVADFISSLPKTHRWLGIIPIVAFIAFFRPNNGNNRETNKIADYLRNQAGTIVINPPTFDLTFIYHYDKTLFDNKLNGKALFKHGIFPIYTLAEVTYADELQLPIYYLDADSYFSFRHNDLKDELTSIYTLTDSVIFKGGYVVYTFSDFLDHE